MSCPICNDTQWKSVDVDGVERVVRCDCWRDALVNRLMDASRVPSRFARTELETYQPNEDSQDLALLKARQFVSAFPVVEKGLLFHGSFGVGKTHLAVGVLKAVIRKTGAHGFFFETPDLLRQIRNTYNSRVDETEMGLLRPILEAEILVLDDLGAEKTSEWVQETLGLVINSRYNTRRPTIVTSNLDDSADKTDPNSFGGQIGGRTRSRLLEMCEWVRIGGADRRDGEGRNVTPTQSSQQLGTQRNGLPGKAGGQARAQLRSKQGPIRELGWTGGKAGS